MKIIHSLHRPTFSVNPLAHTAAIWVQL